jgi:hypothetical protein
MHMLCVKGKCLQWLFSERTIGETWKQVELDRWFEHDRFIALWVQYVIPV